ncbi:hypothetical protein POUND7_002820 [Theobroma cacao]
MSSGNGEEVLNSRHACAACKHQRRKCDNDCVFAPHFPANRAHYFREVHKIFGVKNVTNLLEHLDDNDRRRAVESLEWEAFAWKEDPVLGPLGLFKKLEKELELLKEQLNNPQPVMPYQTKSGLIGFNHNSAGFVANGDDISIANFGYANSPNLGLDVNMNNYAGFFQRADNMENQGVNNIPVVPYYPIPEGQGRLVMQERVLDPVVRTTPVLPKQDAQSNQIIGSSMRPASHQRGSQGRAHAYYDGSVSGPQARRMH